MTVASGLGVGIVGGGFMGQLHSRAARAAGARLVGLASSTPERARISAAELGVESAFDTIEELIFHPDVDIVHLCTPNSLHAAQAELVLRAGKHVVCEKPLATSLADATHLAELAAACGVTATVPFAYRFHPTVREARARVQQGAVGQILTIQGVYLQDWLLPVTADNWRVDAARGGRSRAFADIGSHLADMTEFVTGDRLRRVAATTRTYFADRSTTKNITTEDAAALVFETESGVVGTFLVSQLAAGRKNRLALEISGANEAVAFDGENPELLWLGRSYGAEVRFRDAETMSPDAARLCRTPVGHSQGYQDAFNGFVSDTYAAVAGQVPDGLPLFADGRRAVAVTEAVMDSAQRGAWVEVADYR